MSYVSPRRTWDWKEQEKRTIEWQVGKEDTFSFPTSGVFPPSTETSCRETRRETFSTTSPSPSPLTTTSTSTPNLNTCSSTDLPSLHMMRRDSLGVPSTLFPSLSSLTRFSSHFRVIIRVRPPLPRELQDGHDIEGNPTPSPTSCGGSSSRHRNPPSSPPPSCSSSSCISFSNIFQLSERDPTSLTVFQSVDSHGEEFPRSSSFPSSSCSSHRQPHQHGRMYPQRTFHFDHVAGADTDQQKFYEICAKEVVMGVLHGVHGTLLAYGQTGTGKTYTMEGFTSARERGIIPRAVEDIFEFIAATKRREALEKNKNEVEEEEDEVEDFVESPDQEPNTQAKRSSSSLFPSFFAPTTNNISSSIGRSTQEMNSEENKKKKKNIMKERRTKSTTFRVTASFMQIYNEVVSDLLRDEKKDSSSSALPAPPSPEQAFSFSSFVPPPRRPLRVLHQPQDGSRGGSGSSSVVVDGLTEWEVQSEEEVYELIERGTALRETWATHMSECSSRSHAIFTLKVEVTTTITTAKVSPFSPSSTTTSTAGAASPLKSSSTLSQNGSPLHPLSHIPTSSTAQPTRILYPEGIIVSDDGGKSAQPRQEEEEKEEGSQRGGAGGPTSSYCTSYTVAKLNIVDLAGSEKIHHAGVSGQRLEETKCIHKSLHALGNVMAALVKQQESSPRPPPQKQSSSRTLPSKGKEAAAAAASSSLSGGSGAHYIPFRNSVLTRILQDSLGGNCLTVLIACVSPCISSYAESLSTLSFACRARGIRNHAVVNARFSLGDPEEGRRESGGPPTLRDGNSPLPSPHRMSSSSKAGGVTGNVKVGKEDSGDLDILLLSPLNASRMVWKWRQKCRELEKENEVLALVLQKEMRQREAFQEERHRFFAALELERRARHQKKNKKTRGDEKNSWYWEGEEEKAFMKNGRRRMNEKSSRLGAREVEKEKETQSVMRNTVPAVGVEEEADHASRDFFIDGEGKVTPIKEKNDQSDEKNFPSESSTQDECTSEETGEEERERRGVCERGEEHPHERDEILSELAKCRRLIEHQRDVMVSFGTQLEEREKIIRALREQLKQFSGSS